MDCLICTRLALARTGDEPHLIAELSESFVVLHEHQPFEGWCVLWLKEHAEHLEQLPIGRQARLWEDVARVAAAIRTACSPRRLNYACLCNQVAHLHWHVIPRYTDDPAPLSAVWSRPENELNCGVTPVRRDAIIARLREAGLR